MADTFLKKSLFDIEQVAYTSNTAAHDYLSQCVSEIRRLQHELADPNYQMSGRIHRAAVLCRDATIETQRQTIKKLEEQIKVLEALCPQKLKD